MAGYRKIFSFGDINKALKLSFSIFIPALLLSYLGYFEIGFAIAGGAFLVGITDHPGFLRANIIGGVAATVTVFVVTLFVKLLIGHTLLLSLLILLLSFVLSMLTVYGARGINIAFSGLIAMVIVLSGNVTGMSTLSFALWHAVGGLWFMLVSLSFYSFRPYHQTVDAIGITINNLVKYFGLRRKLIDRSRPYHAVMSDLLNMQVELNANQEQVREILLEDRKAISGRSTISRSLVILFVELVDLMDLAMATLYKYEDMSREDIESEPVRKYLLWVLSIERELMGVERSLREGSKLLPSRRYFVKAAIFVEAVKKYKSENSYVAAEKKHFFSLLDMMIVFSDRVNRRVEVILHSANLQTPHTSEDIRNMKLRNFQTKGNFSFQRILDNLNITSNSFRYSVRMSLALFAAYCITEFTGIGNPHWVLLTIIVILRPAYGVSKERMYNRVVGTVIGGFVALGILYLGIPKEFLVISIMISMFLSFIYLTRDYRLSVLFTTLFVVFLYGLLKPDEFDIVEARIFDTIMGAVYSIGFNFFVLPSAERLYMPQLLSESIQRIKNLYITYFEYTYGDESFLLKYKSERKEATIATANLNSALQRLLREPEFKNKEMTYWQEVVSLNHTIYLATLSLFTIIDSNRRLEINDRLILHKQSVLINIDSILETIQNIPDVNKINVLQEECKDIKQRLFRSEDSIAEDEIPRELEDQMMWIYSLTNRLFKICNQSLDIDNNDI